NKIVLMQGRLKPEEETLLIKQTMEMIEDNFKGVEICTIFPEERDLQFVKRFKKEMMRFIIGNRDGITIVGPASIIKEIKRDINNIQLLAAMPKSYNLTKRTRRPSKRPSRKSSRRAKSSRRGRR
ncbi:MAG: DUF2073 domain-containing protein, partial [Nanoarchaeota archaeon]